MMAKNEEESLDIKSRLNRLEDSQEMIIRRLDMLGRQLDNLDSDRQILENIQGRLTSLEEQARLARLSDKDTRNDIKEEVQINGNHVKEAVQKEVGQIKEWVEKRKVVPKEKRTIFQRLFRRR